MPAAHVAGCDRGRRPPTSGFRHRHGRRDEQVAGRAKAMGSKKPDLIDIEVGQRIRIQRLALGLSQTELAERIGVTFQQVQKYEKGANRVGAGRLTQIAKVLSVTVGSFFDGREAIDKVARQGFRSPLAAMAQPYAYRLLRAYSTIADPDL